jgi:Flp pilus assembly protein CpaB
VFAVQSAKRRAILFGLLSLIFASVAGVLFLNKTEEVDKKLGEKTTIYVAIKNINPRETLSPDFFAAQEIPTQYVPPTALQSLKGIEQFVAVVPLVKGDMLTTHFLRKSKELTSGSNRLVFLGRSEKVIYDQEVDRFDHVDIIVNKKENNGEPKTYLLLKDIPVIVAARDKQKIFQGAGIELPLEAAIQLIHEQTVAESIRILKAPQNETKEKQN